VRQALDGLLSADESTVCLTAYRQPTPHIMKAVAADVVADEAGSKQQHFRAVDVPFRADAPRARARSCCFGIHREPPLLGYVYTSDASSFIVTRPIDGQSATYANGGTIGFVCQSVDQLQRWHSLGIANGGRSNEDPPGVRITEGGRLYLAYMRDPDGNKLCALHRCAG